MSFLGQVEQEVAEVGKLARYVVAKRVAVVSVVAVVLNLLIAYHIITPDISNHLENYLKSALDALAVIIAVLYAQKGVTPLNSPRDKEGVPLVSAVRAQAAIDSAEVVSSEAAVPSD